jgi:sugar lactone lactonase YvrE
VSRWALYEPIEPAAAPGWRFETIVPAARHYPTNGIRVASDGRLWITQVLGRHVTSLDPDTNEQRIVVALGAGLRGPDDLAFDRRGNTFLTEPHDDRVMRVTPDGRVEVWADELPSANGITISKQGRLFIDECRPGGRLIEIDADEAGRTRVIAGDLGMPNALEMGPDGWLYVPEVAANRVLAVDPDSGATRIAVDDVHRPSAVKFDNRGRVVVTEAGSGKVTRVDLTTGPERQVLACLAPGLDNLAFAGAHTLYVSSFVTGAIFRVDLESGAIETLSPPRLITANGVSLSNDGQLIVSDRMSVVRVGPERPEIERLVCVPVDMQFAIDGAVLIGETLCVLTTAGTLMQRRAENGLFHEFPTADVTVGVSCIAFFDQLLFAGRGNDVVTIDLSGVIHRSIATGLRVDAVAAFESTVAACDRRAGTVVLFDGDDPSVWTGFTDPAAVTLSADAVFIAEDIPRRIVRVERSTGARSVVATHVPFGSPLAGHSNGVGPPSLCATADGSVIVGCSGDASLRRLSAQRG